ncbi:MAG: AAA family ATPase [Desulfovibrionaceae bacterium]|nr:AAA family ATPase [Desulfovibrionaceae bacterium]
MKRTIFSALQSWKKFPYRKPLLLVGARQTGKSWILKEFGQKEFEYCIVIDFEEDSEEARKINSVISSDGLHASKILEAAGLDGTLRRPDNTLVIFDEIQRNPRMFTCLKYISEKRPDVYVASSGSLMGLALKSGTRAPVGCVDVEYMFPMTFYEFLEAANETEALFILRNGLWERYEKISKVLEYRLRQYIAVGGMPKPLSIFLETNDLRYARKEQNNILSIYEQDFNVHLEDVELTEKIRYAWRVACTLSGERNESGIFLKKYQISEQMIFMLPFNGSKILA